MPSIARSAVAAMFVGGIAATLAAWPAFADSAEYQVRIDSTWTAKSHPQDYPGNAHLSGLVGATHNADYTIFADGKIATEGLRKLSEMGAHSPLDTEIRAAIAKGAAGQLFESGPLFQFPGSIAATFNVDDKHPLASVVAMIAPSPDWFLGASHVALQEGGKWVEKKVVTLYAWDAGTDMGATYASPDAEALPRQSIRLNVAAPFMNEGGLVPVGTVTFTRVQKSAGK